MRDRAVVARQAHNLEVGGSNPSPATKVKFGNIAQQVERRTVNPQVVGSNPTVPANGTRTAKTIL